MSEYWKLKKALPNALNQELINDFLLSMKLANRSQDTITGYRTVLQKFFLDQKEPITSLTSTIILQWLQANVWHLKETTISRHISVLSCFCTFCVEEEYLEHSPIKSRWYPRIPHPVPKYLEREDIAKTRLQSERTSLRAQVLIEFMLTSGCRVGEVQRLNREDVDFVNRTARVMGKGKKIRNVHFTEKCALLLERYIASCPNVSPAVFVSLKNGKRLGTAGIRLIVK